jgi:hypothetical protein
MTKGFSASLATVALMAALAAPSQAADKGIAAAKKAIGDSAVTVLYYLQYDDGDAPTGSNRDYNRSSSGHDWAGTAISDERPVHASGFLVAKDLVLASDLMIEPRFVKRIEVVAAGKTYAAVPERFALDNSSLVLKLSEPAIGARPLAFKKNAKRPYFFAGFYDDQGQQSMFLSPMSENEFIDRTGKRFIRATSPTIIVTADGTPVGAALSDRLWEGGDWQGSPLDWPAVSASQYDDKAEAVRKIAAAGLLQVTINMRVQTSRRASTEYDAEEAATEPEIDAVGLLYAPNRVLVLEEMTRRKTALIESMTLACGDKSVSLKVEGALEKYGAILASFEGELPGATPLQFDDTGAAAKVGQLFIGDDLSYDKGARDERLSRAHITARGQGFLDLVWPKSSPESSQFLFTLDGKLAALPLSRRDAITMESRNYRQSRDSVLMPGDRLADMLARPAECVDANYKPLSEQDTKRFVWLGIEMQEISHDLAKAKGAALATKGGSVGGLITYVYKGSPAERAGVKAGDIIVRFTIPGQTEPVDIQLGEQRDFDFPWSKLDQVPDVYFDRIPRPWPSQNNELAHVLTEVGAGKTVTALFVAGGGPKSIDFTLEMTPPDFATAESYENKAAGLTVKDATYEVRHYFKMSDTDPGVVAAEIEPGSKTSVAGVKPCEIITAVNGKPVHNVAEFKSEIEKGGDVELTVKRMSQSRVAKMTLPAPGAKEETKPATPAVESTADVAATLAVAEEPKVESTAPADATPAPAAQ